VSFRTSVPKSAREAATKPATPRATGNRRGDLLALAGLVILAGLIEYLLRNLLTRPFDSDEAWRAYDITLGTRFVHHLNASGAPLAFGWVGIENVARIVLGNTEAALRAPMFVAFPALGVATYLLARRWLGIGPSFCAGALLLINSWTVNNALQLKSYSYEGLLAIAAVALYLLLRRTRWGAVQILLLSAALGLTCVFSLPNLFVVGPLLVAGTIEAIRGGQQIIVRMAGLALAAAIALAHYALFVSPQSGVAGTDFWLTHIAPHHLGPFVVFTIRGIQSYFPTMLTGSVGAANSVPAYALPPPAHDLLAVVLALLLAAGIVAAVRDTGARVLVIALGAAQVLELIASALHRWPFGMVRVNVFMLPLFYILLAMGVVWLARALRGPERNDASLEDGNPGRLAWWRVAGLGAASAGLAAATVAGGVATGHALAQTRQLQYQPTEFTGVKAAVSSARKLVAPGDLAIIRADRRPAHWYDEGWLYYMHSYQGYPPATAALPAIAGRDTIAVFRVTPAAVDQFLAKHPDSPAIFLLELLVPGNTFPAWLHRESLQTLRQFGYCPARETGYPVTGHLTVLVRRGCAPAGARSG
jgi:hypothetical protein